MQSRPGRYQRGRRLICTVRILICSQSLHFVDAFAEEGSDAAKVGAEGIEASGFDFVIGAFCDDEAGLKVVAAVDEDEGLSVVDIAEHVGRVALDAADAEPEDIDGDSVLDDVEAGGAACNGMAAIATHDEVGADLHLAAVVVRDDSPDAIADLYETGGLVLHEQLKGRKAPGVGGKKVQEIPLRHERDELAGGGHMAEVGNLEGRASDDDTDRLHGLMGQLEKLVQQAEFVEHVEGGGMHGVAAEVAKEIAVLLQYGDLDAAARQKIAEHDAGGAAAYHAAGCVQNFRRHQEVPFRLQCYSTSWMMDCGAGAKVHALMRSGKLFGRCIPGRPDCR